jgi:ribonuclease BN (tRNA processing enzyme)
VEHAGKAVCYITDNEHVPGRENTELLTFLRGADILIYDCMYTEAEFDHFRGYGHSTWEEGVRLCEKSGAKRLVIFHHRPGRDDDDLRRIENDARASFPGAIMAATGLELTP